MAGRSEELERAVEWILPMGVCCAEAQADGIPCDRLDSDCLTCAHADPVRQALLRLATRVARAPRPIH